MSTINNTPPKNSRNFLFRKISRPLTSIVPRTAFHSRRNIRDNNLENDKKSIKYYIQNNLYLKERNRKHHKISQIKNFYNKLHKSDLTGKDKYTNFTLFAKREMVFKERSFSNKNKKKLIRQHSAIQLNPRRMYNDNPFYLTETIIKNHHKKQNNYLYYNEDNSNENFFPYIEFGDKNENIIIDNHKYKNISLLRQIENDKRTNKTPFSEKNYYLFQKKLEYISLNKLKGKKLYNYMEELNEYIKRKYGNQLKAEKAKINYEEYKNQNELANNKMETLKKTNNLYNDLFVSKYNDYIKFLGKQVDKNNKGDYLLLNEIFNLQKEVVKLKNKINKLLEDKKFFNRIIFLQIRVKQKKLKLPEYYDYILNHTLSEGINHYRNILDEKEIKKIYDYKTNIIYKDYKSFLYQVKIYENENRKLLNNLSLVQRELDKLQIEKKAMTDEDIQISNYLDNKMIEKSKERIDIINKYNLLIKEKNRLLKQIQISYVNEKMINIKKKGKKRNKSSFYNNYKRDKSKKNTNKSLDFNYKVNNRSGGGKVKSISIDEQLFLDYKINYDNPENKNKHTILYYKVRKLFFLLKNFIKIEENENKKEKITTENGLILKLLAKIEDAMNGFIENEKNFNIVNKEEIIKIKLKMEKERKIMKGQRQIAMVKAKYENMKKKLEEKYNKIYFCPKNKKRAVSASITKRITKKKEQTKLIDKKEFEEFLEEFNET